MFHSNTILLALFFVIAVSATTTWRRAIQESVSDSPRPDILECYNNETLNAPDKRMPMNMENLIGIIRKLEQHRDFYSWNSMKMAGMLLWRFRYDGIPSENNPKELINSLEWEKMNLIAKLISRQDDNFPEEILTQEEKCALHWMLSYSTDTVYWDDDNIYSQNHEVRRSVQKDHMSQGHGRNLHESLPSQVERKLQDKNINVFETGAVYTPWGTLTAGTVLAGIATDLQKTAVPARKLLTAEQLRQLQSRSSDGKDMSVNAWAATLAGDMGQTAVLSYKKPGNFRKVGPSGKWNNRLTPKIYTLEKPGYNSEERVISYLTDSEIRGGIDGLLLSSKIREWNKDNLKLSQLLDMYYSEMGVSFDRSFRACNRIEKFRNEDTINSQLMEEAVKFAEVYRALIHLTHIWEPNEGLNVMSNIKRDLDSHMSGMDDKGCAWQGENTEPVRETYTDLYMVLDTSVYETEWYRQKNLTAALGITMDIFGNGSHIEVVNGNDGEPFIALYATGNGAELGYIMQQKRWRVQEVKPDFVLNKLRRQFLDLREYEEKKRLSGSNAQVIMFIMFRKIKPEDKEDFKEQVDKLRRDIPDVRLLFATEASKNEFQEYVEDSSKDDDVISLSSFHSAKETNQEMMASRAVQAAEAINKRLQEIPARLFYPHCYTLTNSHTDESGFKHMGYVTPGAVQYFSYGPEQFFTSEDLRIKIKAANGGLKVCWSRNKISLFDKQQHETCKELKPSGTESEVEVTYSGPCGGEDGTHWGCDPIYFSIEGLDTASYCQEEVKLPCKYPNSVKFTITHSGMTCNGALAVLGSPSLGLLTAAVMYLYFSRD